MWAGRGIRLALGFVVQENGLITEVNNAPSIVKQTATDTYDLLRYQINITGLDIRPNDTELSIWVSDGTVFFPGVNWYTDQKNPNVTILPALGDAADGTNLTMMTQTGLISITDKVVPDAYNPSGDTLTGLSGNDATIHRLLNYFPC